MSAARVAERERLIRPRQGGEARECLVLILELAQVTTLAGAER